MTKSDEGVSTTTTVEEDGIGPRSLPPLPTPGAESSSPHLGPAQQQMRARTHSPALATLSANPSVGLSSSADDVVKMESRRVSGSKK